METSLITTGKITHKISQVLPTNYHLPECQYYGFVQIGGKNHYTSYFDSKEEASLELRCLEKRLSFELVETMEGEGYYPERAIIMEQKYQESGRTNGLYTGLIAEDGTVPKHNS
jgi:hypothetical protein